VAAGAAAVAAVAGVDAAAGADAIFVSLLFVGPLLTAGWAGANATAAVGVLATAVAILLGVVDGNVASANHVIEVVAVVMGAGLAVLGARARTGFEAAAATTRELLAREREDRRHADFRASIGVMLELPLDPALRLARLARVAVPAVADLCTVDLLDDDGILRPAATYAADPERAALLEHSRRAHPIAGDSDHPVAVAARTGRTQLVRWFTDDELERQAQSEEHRTVMRSLGYATAVAAPLLVGGRPIGVYSLLRCGSGAMPFTEADADVVDDVARRAALALANARLFRDLSSKERQIEAILHGVAEAVVVRDAGGDVVYGNDAAARLLGAGDPAALVGRSFAGLLLGRYGVLAEGGAPYDPAAALAPDSATPVLVRLVDRETGDERWILRKTTPVGGDDPGERMAVDVLEDVTDTRRAEHQQRILSQASALVASSLDVGATLEKVAWAVVPEVGDWCRVELPDERGRLREVALAHADAARRDVLAELYERYPTGPDVAASPAAVLRHGRPQLIDVTPALMEAFAVDAEHLRLVRRMGTRSLIVVPMTAGERITGTITIGTDESGRRLGPADLELAVGLGRRAGIALENARLHAVRSHIATTLQRGLLPPRLPVVPGLTIAARFRAAGETTEVGGDFYDVFPARGAWMVVMGDVTGKGPSAAAITALARYTMRTAAAYEDSPARILDRLNRALADDPDRRQICTAVCVRLVPAGGRVELTVCCGGHPPPFVVDPGEGAEPSAPPGPLLGAFADARWTERELALEPGQSLVLYTDGVTDTRGHGERFGQERLARTLAEVATREADEVAAHVDEALQAFEVGPQRDDVALLVLRAAEPDAASAGAEAAPAAADAAAAARRA
jgi:serine phosphatase RsbU (regulator of sigma subunit)/PAS domain-containing protein